LFKKLYYPVAPLVLAAVLGDKAEAAFMQSMLFSDGSLAVFWSNPLVGTLSTTALTMARWPLLARGERFCAHVWPAAQLRERPLSALAWCAGDSGKLRRCGSAILLRCCAAFLKYHDDYRKLLDQFGMRASMSGKANCHDYAPMESFWGSLKNELAHH
jgi:transposase InsO family protein